MTFTNGNHITFVSHGETTLLSEKGKLKLQSHLDREEYVARVLDREAKSTPPEAAKAMTVAIRTFLQQNANREGDCLTIPDSSATQRVSASPATTGARTMAAWTQDLIYAGDPVHYHGSRATEGTLSWRQATAQAGQGERYDQILAFAYPDNSLSRWSATLNLPVITQSESLAGEKKCRSGGVYYKLRRGTTNQTCLRFAV